MRTLVTVWLVALCLLSASSCFDDASVACEEETFTDVNDGCLPCHATCAACDGPDANDCTECRNTRIRVENECLCPEGSIPYAVTGCASFTNSNQALGDATSRGVALGDLDGDDDLDAFVANNGANTVWLNDGAGKFTDSGQSLGDSDGNSVALADLNGDTHVDAFVANAG